MTDVVAQLLPLFPAVPLIAAAFALLAPWRAVRDSIMLIIPGMGIFAGLGLLMYTCLLYTSPSPRDVEESRMPSSA